VRETQEVERLRFAQSALGTPSGRLSPELDQTCLLWMHGQPELLYPLTHLSDESLGIGPMFESNNGIVGVTDHDQVSLGLAASPPMYP
jgi:hypothetical protein